MSAKIVAMMPWAVCAINGWTKVSLSTRLGVSSRVGSEWLKPVGRLGRGRHTTPGAECIRLYRVEAKYYLATVAESI